MVGGQGKVSGKNFKSKQWLAMHELQVPQIYQQIEEKNYIKWSKQLSGLGNREWVQGQVFPLSQFSQTDIHVSINKVINIMIHHILDTVLYDSWGQQVKWDMSQVMVAQEPRCMLALSGIFSCLFC